MTLAPLTTAPDGSVTVPWMLPVEMVVCANVAAAEQNNTPMERSSKESRRKILQDKQMFINLPLFQFVTDSPNSPKNKGSEERRKNGRR
jgi:hypothetical protein